MPGRLVVVGSPQPSLEDDPASRDGDGLGAGVGVVTVWSPQEARQTISAARVDALHTTPE